jgi:signal transduction histidine kinase
VTLLRSLSFRLALLYLAVFAASVTALGGIYYWLEVYRPLEAIKAEVENESAALRDVYDRNGEDGLALALEERAAAGTPRIGYHALLDSRGNSITANLPSWPHAYAPGWKHIEADVAREGTEDEYEAIVLDQQLGGGLRLLVGRDVDDIDDLEESFRDAVLWIVPALLLLGTLGGALMSRVIAARLDAISGAARAVIEGDLSSRIEVRGSGDDFDRLAATLNLMLERLETSLEAIRRVSDTVAHELRTPVARLQAVLVDLHERPAADGAAEALAEASRLQTVIDAVLRVSRIEAGRHSIALEPVDLSALLADVVEFYQPEADARSQRLEVSVEEGLMVAGDRDLLFQGFANLLDNAVKFTPEGGVITATAAAANGQAIVQICNDGGGVSPELRDRVGERFFRGANAAGVPGLGLGLALVAAVASAHRSSLEFRPEGKRFCAHWQLACPPRS